METKTKVIDLLNQLFSLIIILTFTLFVFRVLTRIENNQLPAITADQRELTHEIMKDMDARHQERLKAFYANPESFRKYMEKGQ